MADKREFYKTKSFYGFLAIALGMVFEYYPLTQPYAELLFSAGALWTGYSVADRLRK